MKEEVPVVDGMARMDLTIWLDAYILFFFFASRYPSKYHAFDKCIE